MLLKVHPDNPSARKIGQVAALLREDGVIIFPTDTIYALACCVDSKKGFERICRIKQVLPKKAVFSMIVSDLRMASAYLAQIETPAYRLLNKHLPGPYTFILKSGQGLPTHMKSGRKTIGVRIPDHNVSRAIVAAIDQPLITTSVRTDDPILKYYTDPEEIFDAYKHLADCVIDAGTGTFDPSTVVDLSQGDPVVIREGKGALEF